MPRRLKILFSAYACWPGEGSEPGVGWNVARAVAPHHDVWVLTRSAARPLIDSEVARAAGIRPLYCDVPGWPRGDEIGVPAIHVHYYLWQLAAYFAARRAHATIGFDLAHHVTYLRYSTPSFVSQLPIPFVLGPLGGGEMAPPTFERGFAPRDRRFEWARRWTHRLGEIDPFTRGMVRRSVAIRATTEQTAARLRKIGAAAVTLAPESGLWLDEIERLSRPPPPLPFRVISLSRLLHWKAIDLGLRAFAAAGLGVAQYWIVGDGPERERLEALANELGIGAQTVFTGRLPHDLALEKLAAAHVLVHPSLHDSGGWVCLEAMAIGRPVICLDVGGPQFQVTAATGIKVAVQSPQQAVADMAAALRRLAADGELGERMGRAGRERVREHFTWEARGRELSELYERIVPR